MTQEQTALDHIQTAYDITQSMGKTLIVTYSDVKDS